MARRSLLSSNVNTFPVCLSAFHNPCFFLIIYIRSPCLSRDVFAVWTEDAIRAYNKIFSPIIKRDMLLLRKGAIEDLKAKDSSLEAIPVSKIKNKINAQLQKLKRQTKCRNLV